MKEEKILADDFGCALLFVLAFFLFDDLLKFLGIKIAHVFFFELVSLISVDIDLMLLLSEIMRQFTFLSFAAESLLKKLAYSNSWFTSFSFIREMFHSFDSLK